MSSEGDLMAQAERDALVVLKWRMTEPVMEFDMPADARVIKVRTQDNVPTIWTLSTDTGQTTRRTFVGHGTGHLITEPDNLKYVGSAHDVEGWMVFHIFERAEKGESRSGSKEDT